VRKLLFNVFFISGRIVCPVMAQAVTFTRDTLIDANDPNCEEHDIFIDACNLRVFLAAYHRRWKP